MKIKICGLKRAEDIDYVNEALPDYAGFIINFPKSHRNLDIQTARQLAGRLDKRIQAAAVIVDQPLKTAEELLYSNEFDVIQLHGHEDNDYIDALKGCKQIWKAFRIIDENDLARAAASHADKVILDNGYGTGERFNWNLAKSAHGLLGDRFILAGGLTLENIAEAAEIMQPWGIDISSGVETDGYKDKSKILAINQRLAQIDKDH